MKFISTGGTKKILKENKVDVTSITELTGFDSIMDGRVKTLHPKVFGGILADKKNKNHVNDLLSIKSSPIDLVVVNLYPFVQEAVKKKLPLEKAIEYIDIGGPSMLRAADTPNSIEGKCSRKCLATGLSEFTVITSKISSIFPQDQELFFASFANKNGTRGGYDN